MEQSSSLHLTRYMEQLMLGHIKELVYWIKVQDLISGAHQLIMICLLSANGRMYLPMPNGKDMVFIGYNTASIRLNILFHLISIKQKLLCPFKLLRQFLNGVLKQHMFTLCTLAGI